MLSKFNNSSPLYQTNTQSTILLLAFINLQSDSLKQYDLSQKILSVDIINSFISSLYYFDPKRSSPIKSIVQQKILYEGSTVANIQQLLLLFDHPFLIHLTTLITPYLLPHHLINPQTHSDLTYHQYLSSPTAISSLTLTPSQPQSISFIQSRSHNYYWHHIKANLLSPQICHLSSSIDTKLNKQSVRKPTPHYYNLLHSTLNHLLPFNLHPIPSFMFDNSQDSPQTSPTQTTTQLITPSLNVTPAEPVLSRPSLPRSVSAIELFSDLLLIPSSPRLRRRLSLLPVSDSSIGRPRRPPFLMRHQRTKSAEPSLTIISSFPGTVFRPKSGSAEALLQRALEEDEDARSWADVDELLDYLEPDQPVDPPEHLPPQPIIQMDPLLADLEAKSRLNVQTECAICQKKGINYPKCPKCQLEFCSRACRVSMGDGERHKCA